MATVSVVWLTVILSIILLIVAILQKQYRFLPFGITLLVYARFHSFTSKINVYLFSGAASVWEIALYIALLFSAALIAWRSNLSKSRRFMPVIITGVACLLRVVRYVVLQHLDPLWGPAQQQWNVYCISIHLHLAIPILLCLVVICYLWQLCRGYLFQK